MHGQCSFIKASGERCKGAATGRLGLCWAHDPANKAAIIEMIVTRTSTTPTVAERVYDFYVAKNPHLVGVEDLQVEPVQTVAQILREWENLPDLPPDNVWRDGSYIQRARQLAGQ